MDVGERWGSRARARGKIPPCDYLCNLSETLQEQFITDIRAILGSQNFIMTLRTLSTTRRNRFPLSMVKPET